MFLSKWSVQRPIAMTALIIVEDCDLDAVIEVPKEASGTEGSSVYLAAGEKLTVRDLLYGLMLRSGNDCAVTLALYHSGSIPAFAEYMNERAEALGAEHSHFANPHGLPSKGHYTTARDLALIAAAALRNETFFSLLLIWLRWHWLQWCIPIPHCRSQGGRSQL